MVDLLFYNLLKAVPQVAAYSGGRYGPVPSVAGNVADMITRCSTVRACKHLSGPESMIVVNAHRINGSSPLTGSKDFLYSGGKLEKVARIPDLAERSCLF